MDGAGSGLDADLLDGKHASDLFDTSKRFTVSGTLPSLTLHAQEYKLVQHLYLTITSAHRVYLRRGRFVGFPGFKLEVKMTDSWASTGAPEDTKLDLLIFDGTSSRTFLEVAVYNPRTQTQTSFGPVSWWFEVEVIGP